MNIGQRNWVDSFINKKQSNDKGVDRHIWFETDNGDYKKMVLHLKGGKHLKPAMVKELRGTMVCEGSDLAGLLLTEKPKNSPCTNVMKTPANMMKATTYKGIWI